MINLDLAYSLAHLAPKPFDWTHLSWAPWPVKSMVPNPNVAQLKGASATA